jgi:hypothetical protein
VIRAGRAASRLTRTAMIEELSKCVVLANLAVDVIQAAIDPRIRV